MCLSPVAVKANLMQPSSKLAKTSLVFRVTSQISQILTGCMTRSSSRKAESMSSLPTPAGEFVPLEAITEAHFDKTFNINVKGLLFTVQKALPLFQDGGSIILTASIASFKGIEALSVYSATKATIRSFARTWTVDLKHRKIRVNAISPGSIVTPGYRTSLRGLVQTAEQLEQFKASQVGTIPLGWIGSPEDVAKVVSFLASDDSGFITGIELFVDGGMAQI